MTLNREPALGRRREPGRDPDGDDLYEDVDGDGTANYADAIELYNGL